MKKFIRISWVALSILATLDLNAATLTVVKEALQKVGTQSAVAPPGKPGR